MVIFLGVAPPQLEREQLPICTYQLTMVIENYCLAPTFVAFFFKHKAKREQKNKQLGLSINLR